MIMKRERQALSEGVTRRELGLFAAGALGGVRVAGGSGGVERWRADFPALQQTIEGRPLAYLDSAATTQRPLAVIETIGRFYRESNANPSPSLHTLARRAHEQYEESRRAIARFVNARDASEIVWTRGTTEAINLVAATWGAATIRAGDEIVLSIAEHYSNLLPWRAAAERAGATVIWVDVDDEGRLRLDDLDRKLSKRTRLVALSHVSNVLGCVNPAAEVAALARERGARVLLDGAQSVPHIPIDVQALGCDFLAFSSHKMAGPMGVGVLWARRELLEEMPPYQLGSNMAHDVELDSVTYEHAALKFGAGTPNVSGPLGLAAAAGYLTSLGRESIRGHEQSLTGYALGKLASVSGLRLLGPATPAERLPVFSFNLDGWAPAKLARELDAQGIAIRAGDLAALPLLKRFGVAAAARASCYLYTTREEIDRLVAALERLSSSAGGRDRRDDGFR
jgi:cysteine desulfurase/selenocysteine lyase